MPGGGPVKVITDKGILEADPVSGELVLTTTYPGVSAGEVASGVSWPLVVCPVITHAQPPAAHELELLRRVLDPHKLYLKD